MGRGSGYELRGVYCGPTAHLVQVFEIVAPEVVAFAFAIAVVDVVVAVVLLQQDGTGARHVRRCRSRRRRPRTGRRAVVCEFSAQHGSLDGGSGRGGGSEFLRESSSFCVGRRRHGNRFYGRRRASAIHATTFLGFEIRIRLQNLLKLKSGIG